MNKQIMDIEIKENILTAQQFEYFYKSVDWQAPTLEQINTALKNSLVTFCVFDKYQPVAMARLLGDSAMSYYIKDFIVHPIYQGKGIRKALINHIDNYIKSQISNDWSVCVELMSAKGKEDFYSRFGFESRPSQRRGAGMFKFLCNN